MNRSERRRAVRQSWRAFRKANKLSPDRFTLSMAAKAAKTATK